MPREELLYQSKRRRIILSEQSFHTPDGPDGETIQTTAYCYAYTEELLGIELLLQGGQGFAQQVVVVAFGGDGVVARRFKRCDIGYLGEKHVVLVLHRESCQVFLRYLLVQGRQEEFLRPCKESPLPSTPTGLG